MMIFLRPILSDNAPKTVKNGIPINKAMAMMMLAVRGFTFRMDCM